MLRDEGREPDDVGRVVAEMEADPVELVEAAAKVVVETTLVEVGRDEEEPAPAEVVVASVVEDAEVVDGMLEVSAADVADLRGDLLSAFPLSPSN